MKPFAAPIDDILFSLAHVAKAGDLAGHDAGLSAEIIQQFAPFAEQVIAPLNQSGDRQGCRLENGRVRMPDGFADAYRQLCDGGWQAASAPEEFGGMGLDGMTMMGLSEIFTGANHALQMVCGLVPGAISTLVTFADKQTQDYWIPRLASGASLNTMCLTEAGAGSDLGRMRTKAERDGDGWLLNGEKIFISGGDQDMSEDILHFVLARTGAPDSGTRGLSLFLCPSQHDGVANNVTVARIEEKLGIHASPTCQLVFSNARATLIGRENEGLKAMFTLMNHARIDVALQGIAHSARAYDIAHSYAGERSQGRDQNQAPARLNDHADVRQMLDEQRALTVGGRAMCHIAMRYIEEGEDQDLVDFLTPICKIFGSEAGIRSADLGIQVLGGYGYLEEYNMAQTWRDARITSIYEGANGIHAIATATRGLRLNDGAGADAFAALVQDLAGGNADLMELLDHWQGERAKTAAQQGVPTNARDFAGLTAELFFRAVWVRLAAAAQEQGATFADEFAQLAAQITKNPPPTARFTS